MRLWLILLQGDDLAWLEAAWDDEATASNRPGWEAEVDRCRKMALENNLDMRICEVTVPGLYDLFDIPELTGKLGPAPTTLKGEDE